MDKRKIPESGEWAFLRGYESPIVEENLEMLSERGRKDAKVRLGFFWLLRLYPFYLNVLAALYAVDFVGGRC